MSQRSGDRKRDYPINDVVVVVGFPTEPSIECLRHEFFNGIRDLYSEVIPPVLNINQPAALTPYRFETPDQSSAVFLAADSLGYATLKYEGYEAFKEAFLSLADLLRNTFNISDLTRIVLRYTNIFPYDRKNDEIPLSKYLKVGLSLPKGVPTNFQDFSLGFTLPLGDARVEVVIEPRAKQTPEIEEAIFLTLNYEKFHDIQVPEVGNFLDEAHEKTRYLFKSLINQTYWKSLERKGAST